MTETIVMRTATVRHRQRIRHRIAGFTLIELVVSITLLGIVVASIGGVMLNVQRRYFAQREASRADESIQTAELVISRLLRTARADPLAKGIGKIDPDPMARGAWDNVRARGDFNPADGDVNDLLEDVQLFTRGDTLHGRWIAGGQTGPVAMPIRSLRFQYYRSNGTEITTATAVDSASRVKLTIKAPRVRGTNDLVTKESWIFLRNGM